MSQYTITFNPSPGTCNVQTYIFQAGATVTSLPNAKLLNNIFLGWYNSTDPSKNIVSLPFIINSNITLNASWSPQNIFTITYNVDGGFCHIGENSYVGGYVLSAFPTATLSNNVFSGWFLDGDVSQNIINTPYTVTSNVILNALWTPDPGTIITVTYDAQGGYTNTLSTNHNRGTYLASVPSVRRTGYTYGGWYLSNDSTKTPINIPYALTTNITLYALWIPNVNYTITYNPQGGVCRTLTNIYQAGSSVTSSPSATYSGFVFNGWSTVAGSTANIVTFPYIINSNVTFYALWSPVQI